MYAAVASANSTSSFKLSVDGGDITEEIAVPAASEGENNFDDYNEVETGVSLTEGEHILRFTVTGDWMDIDYIKFCVTESCEDISAIRELANGVDIGRENPEPLSVFSVTGRLLGHVENASSSVQDLPMVLKQSNYARGVYVIRGKGLAYRVKVH